MKIIPLKITRALARRLIQKHPEILQSAVDALLGKWVKEQKISVSQAIAIYAILNRINPAIFDEPPFSETHKHEISAFIQ